MNNVINLSDHRDRKTKTVESTAPSGVAQLADYRDKKIGNFSGALVFGRDANGAIDYPALPADDDQWAQDLKAGHDQAWKYAKAAHDTNLSADEASLDWVPSGVPGGKIALKGAMRAGDTIVTAEGSIAANHPAVPEGVANQAPQISHDDIA